MKICPECGKETSKAFYLGFPGWCCERHSPPIVGGSITWIVDIIGFHGAIVAYDKGSYFKTLFDWIIGKIKSKQD